MAVFHPNSEAGVEHLVNVLLRCNLAPIISNIPQSVWVYLVFTQAHTSHTSAPEGPI